MKIGCVMDPIEQVQVHADTTFGWMLAAQARGHEIVYIQPFDLTAEGERAFAWGRDLQVRMPTEADPSHFALGPRRYFPLGELDVCWMRRDPPFDSDYLYSTYLLELADARGECWVLNRPAALRDANEKAFILNFPGAFAPTVITHRRERIRSFMHEQGGRCVVKPLSGHGGEEVFLLNQDDLNLNALLEVITRHESRYVMAQAYIPEAAQGDKRVLLVDGEPLGAVLRVPASGELRGNLHVGGRAVKAELTERDLAICAMLKPTLKARGLHFVGIDLLGPWLTEVNVTSPTGIREMSALDGVDYADRWIAWIEDRLAERSTNN